MEAGSQEELTQFLSGAMQACHDTGIKLPFIVCAVCPNGSVVCMRSTGYGEGSDILAEHYEPEGLLLPINIMVVDQAGAVARMTTHHAASLNFKTQCCPNTSSVLRKA